MQPGHVNGLHTPFPEQPFPLHPLRLTSTQLPLVVSHLLVSEKPPLQ
jgi:hypothetical protein